MLYHLSIYLAKIGGPDFLRFFRYTSTRILAAAITSLLISFLIGPWFIERLKQLQIGQQVRDDGPETHKKKQGTPTMGGSLILLALVVPTILWCDLRNRFVWLTLAAIDVPWACFQLARSISSSIRYPASNARASAGSSTTVITAAFAPIFRSALFR